MTRSELIAALLAAPDTDDGSPVIFEGREGEYHVEHVDTYRGGEDGELIVIRLNPAEFDTPSISKF